MVSEAASFEPRSAARLDPTRLRSFVAAEPEVIDFDGASAWFSSPDLDASVAACDQALNALNLAIDVGATVGDDRLADLVSSPALGPVHDALTFGLTLLGDGSPFRNGPEAMASVVSGEAATTARALFAIVGDHLVFIQALGRRRGPEVKPWAAGSAGSALAGAWPRAPRCR